MTPCPCATASDSTSNANGARLAGPSDRYRRGRVRGRHHEDDLRHRVTASAFFTWVASSPNRSNWRRWPSTCAVSRAPGSCLEIAGAAGPVVVEGPFAANRLYCSALSAIAGTPVAPSGERTGTTLGAALLATGKLAARPAPPAPVEPLRHAGFDPTWQLGARSPGGLQDAFQPLGGSNVKVIRGLVK